jgi:hypothetical protein
VRARLLAMSFLATHEILNQSDSISVLVFGDSSSASEVAPRRPGVISKEGHYATIGGYFPKFLQNRRIGARPAASLAAVVLFLTVLIHRLGSRH